MSAPIVNGLPLSPVHHSNANGVHADLGLRSEKVHIPFEGQTTLDTFTSPSYANDVRLAALGGTYKP